MAEVVTSNRAEYGPNYPYLLECQTNWQKPSYRLWWGLRTYLEVVKPLNLPRGSRILSVGSGMGHIEHFLATTFGHDVTAIDFNMHALEVAESLFDHQINLVAADAENLPFKDGQFDALISFDFMEHLPDLPSAQKTLREMDRVTKGDAPMFHKITVIGEDGMDGDDTHHIKLYADEWEEWFRNRGWSTFRPLKHHVPIWARKRIGLYPVDGAFYLRKD